MTAFAHTADGQKFHEYRYGTGNHLIGRVYTQKYHDQRTAEVVAFLQEAVKKHEAVAKQQIAVPPAGPGSGQRIELAKHWNGVVKDESLRRQIPFGGNDPRVRDFKLPVKSTITTEHDLKRLWQAWRGDEPVPVIDFVQHLVVVVTAGGGGRVQAVPELDKEGNLQIYAWAEASDASGFGYQIALVPRKGVKTVAGKRVACGRHNCGCEIVTKFQPNQVETAALHDKLNRTCWADIAQYEVFKNDADLHRRVLDAAYTDAGKQKKILLYIANTGG